MLYKQVIDKFRSLKKQSYLNAIGRFKGTYAFLGVGQHSIDNLYPCLQHLNVKLKYIYSHTLDNAEVMSRRFAGATATTDYHQILNDPSIDGIFICLKPGHQLTVLDLALRQGKKVFVEKPPCQSLEQLETLLAHPASRWCFPGLQRRFSTATRVLGKHKLLGSAETYRYVFQTGSYPEGDVETELFIHPVDFILQLFGDYKKIQVQSHRSNNGITYHLQVEHKSGVKGQVELSTQHSWNNVWEAMEVNTPKRTVSVKYPYALTAIDKSTLFNLPVEKITKGPLVKRIYLDAQNFLPSLDNNTLVLQGFFDEIVSYLTLCETGKTENNVNLESLRPVYRFLSEMKSL